MANETADVVINYNGEIYNYQKLRVELEAYGHRFHSQTDTEVIIHAYEEWGSGASTDSTACSHSLSGIAAAPPLPRPRSLRRQAALLVLARRRLPFASEIKAILEHPRVTQDVCYPALNEYFTFQNVLTDRTLSTESAAARGVHADA